MLSKAVNFPEIHRYILAGSLAFLSDLATLYILTEWFGLHYLVSNVFSYSVGLLVVYLLNIKWVFSVRKYQQVSIEFVIFGLIALAGLFLSEALMWQMVETYAMPYLHAKVVATGFVFIFNYALRKFLLFSR